MGHPQSAIRVGASAAASDSKFRFRYPDGNWPGNQVTAQGDGGPAAAAVAPTGSAAALTQTANASGAGVTAVASAPTASTAPWKPFPSNPWALNFTVGVPTTVDFSVYAPEGHDYFEQSDADWPAGVTIDRVNKRIVWDGTGSTGTTANCTISSQSLAAAAADWTARKAAMGADLLEHEDLSTYADRGAWMAYLKSILPLCPSNGVRNSFIGVDFGGDNRFDDPPPGGALAKLYLDNQIHPGGKSSRHIIYASEGASEAGPLWEWPIHDPQSRYYVHGLIRVDGALNAHDYGGSSRKIIFLNHLDFTSGQIVAIMYLAERPFPLAYRVDGSGARQLRMVHNGGPPPYSSNFTLYSMDMGPQSSGGLTDATNDNLWDRRWGPSYKNDNDADPDFAAFPRLLSNRWMHLTYYIDQDYIGTQSRGMWKCWLGEVGGPATLIGMCYRDCNFRDPAVMKAQSVRWVFRPEDPTAANPRDAGLRWGKMMITKGATPPIMPYGYTLPHPGQSIPSYQPIAGTSDD